ncbi:MAG: 5-formyltetrahydrofolate cyclo-ligase [Candidatus Omnitrophica bacterium]|nr:5-formyltetrahydrofolate cyclo-ligase [Candidatus Omnitrophota bacterium]
MDKCEIREVMLKKLKEQEKIEKEKKSGVIKDKLFGLKEFRKAKKLMFYVSLGYEVDTKEMIKETLKMGKTVAVPVTNKEEKTILPSRIVDFEMDLSPSNFGILEPKREALRLIPQEDLELVVIPGIAFDKRGARIGHGGGFYDRFLKTLSPGTKTIGLAFDFQILDFLPADCQDIPVSMVISA